MELVIPSFDKFKAYAKRHLGIKTQTKEVDTASFLSLNFPQVPFIIDDERGGWDGKEQALVLKANIGVMDAIHEAWHYFMCPPDMLEYNDFGLGSSPQGFNMVCPHRRTDEEADREESVVCYFAIATARKLRLPKEVIVHEMEYANLMGFFINGKDRSRDEYNEEIKLAKQRDLERFGFKVTFPC